ncbi:proton-conducting transporter membrane subunit [Aggregatilineales bacterium SYSU G02658]
MPQDLAFWLPVVIAVPLMAAVLAFLLPRAAFPISLGAALITSGLVCWAALAAVNAGPATHTVGGWSAPLGIDLVLDGLSGLLLVLTAIIGLAITVYAHGYFQPGDDLVKQHQYNFFWPLWMFLWASLNALFLSADVFNLYVTLELLGFSAVALTALAGKPTVLKAAMRYLMVSLSGSLFYLMGVVFLYAQFGTLDIRLLSAASAETPTLLASAALITTGLIMKSALFPLHFWLPPAHANAAAPVSALLSALVVKGSLYIVLRLWLEVFYPLADTVAPQVLSVLGVGAVLWGSLQAMQQPRLKLLIAYSTVAQLGYMFLLMPILLKNRDDSTALAATMSFVFAHAVAKAAAFLSAGSILHALKDDRLTALSGLMKKMPVTTAAFAMAGISLIALPPSAGFLAKYQMLQSALTNGYWGLVFVVIGGGLLAAVYIMRVLGPAFKKVEPYGAESTSKAVHVPLVMSIPTLALALLAIVISFMGVYLLELLAVGTPWVLKGGL